MRRRAATLAGFLSLGLATGAAAEPTIFSSTRGAQIEPTWLWVAGASAVALVVGFVLGWRTLDRRIRRKYGGLKIY
jgi:hypothetical protein